MNIFIIHDLTKRAVFNVYPVNTVMKQNVVCARNKTEFSVLLE